MKPAEPVFRKLITEYFSANKQVNMESEAAQRDLAKYIVEQIPPQLFVCPSDLYCETEELNGPYDYLMTRKDFDRERREKSWSHECSV
tara:strand:+ start:354 stop:617 length:264 start_codon:yes stop_codon:yes gene_type:complete